MTAPTIPPHIRAQFDTPDKRALAPTKPPEEGAFGLMRNGRVARLRKAAMLYHAGLAFILPDGTAPGQRGFDIIAVWHAPAQEAAPDAFSGHGKFTPITVRADTQMTTPPADPLDAVRAAIRGLSEDDLARMATDVAVLFEVGGFGLKEALELWAGALK